MKCAQALISFEADVNSMDESGSTPLHHAVTVGNVEITVLLLDKGADVQLTDKDNLTALEMVSEMQTVAHKAIMVILLRHYERISLPLPRAVKLKLSIQSAEIAAAATGMHHHAMGAVSMGDRAKSNQTLPGATATSSSAVIARPAHSSSPPRTMYDQVVVGDAYEPDKSYKALKMKAAQDSQLLDQRQHPQRSNVSPLTRPPSSHSLSDSLNRLPKPANKSPPRAGSPNGAGIPVFAIRHMNTPSSPKTDDSMKQTKRGNSLVAAALSAVDTPMYAKSMSISLDHDNRPHSESPGLDLVELQGNERDVSSFLKSHVSSSSINAAKLQGMGMQPLTASSTSMKLNEDSVHSEPEVPTITQADIEPENSPLLQDFPNADFIPFLPENNASLGDVNPSHLDVLIEVEHCCDCQYHNDMTLRHDPKKYIQVANNIIHGLVKAIASNNFSVRVFAMRSKITSQRRIGALEVTISARIAVPEVTDSELPRVPSFPPPNNRTSMLVAAHNNAGSSSHLTRSNSMAGGMGSKKLEKEKEVATEVVREKLNLPKPRWQSTVLYSKLHSKL